MKLILGIGNPGKEYENTRHNIGFDVIDNILIKLNIHTQIRKFNAIYYEYYYEKEKIIFIKPQCYVNLTGQVLKKFVDFYKININDILIISDDLDMNIGKYKLKSNGSSGGHNGLKNIEEMLNTNQYKRLKIGISNNKSIETKNYVLSKFSSEERKIIDEIIKTSVNIIIDYLKYDFNKLMNIYNNK